MKRITFIVITLITSYGLFAQNNGNFSIGDNAFKNNTTGRNNTCVGVKSGFYNTEGINNTFVGLNSGFENKSGNNNTFFGTGTGKLNKEGINNTFVGQQSGFNNNGNDNTFFGNRAGYDNTTGKNNIFVGNFAGRYNTTGNDNTYIGFQSGYNAIGTRNIFLGYQAGLNEAGSNKLCIDNSGTDKPLIYGDFDKNALTLNGSVGVGEAIPQGAKIPNDIQLYVNNRFVQKISGELGSFTETDKWSSLGESFAPPGVDIDDIYGMFNVWGNRTFTSGVKDKQHGVVSWGGPAARLDFDYLDNDNESNTFMSITAAGNVGIGNVNPRNYKLVVDGDALTTGDWILSDSRTKDEIENISDAMATIDALNGVSYLSKGKSNRLYGLIAQEVEQVLPELVKEDAAGYYAVNYDGFIPVLIEGMKEQQEIIEEERETNSVQQEVIKNLSERLEQLEAQLDNQKQANPSENTSSYSTDTSIVLKQNNPNPLSEATNIEYEIPVGLSQASLIILDMNGRQIANYPVSGKGNVVFDAKNLAVGTYTYSIVTNGQPLVSRKMVVQ